MMKHFKKMAVLLFAVCFIVGLSACSNGNGEYENLSSFEYHFYPEEYEEEYSEVKRDVQLESSKDYKFHITSTCKDGSIKIVAEYNEADDGAYLVDSNSPCDEWLEIPSGTATSVKFTINIGADTEGEVIVETLTR